MDGYSHKKLAETVSGRKSVCDRDCFRCPHPDCILNDTRRNTGYKDPEKRREYQRAWRARNPELRKEYQKKYYKRVVSVTETLPEQLRIGE